MKMRSNMKGQDFLKFTQKKKKKDFWNINGQKQFKTLRLKWILVFICLLSVLTHSISE